MATSVRDMFVLALGFQCEGKSVAVLYAFFDGSSTHAGAKVWTLCGFLGEFDEFNKLDEKWNRVLDKNDWPNRLKEFHMYDCVHAEGEFKTWSFADRLAMFGELATTVTEANILALGSIVIVDDLGRLDPADLALLKSQGLGDPVDLSMQYIMQNALSYTRKHSQTEDVGLFFDIESNPTAQRYLEFAELYRSRFGNVLKGIAFGDSEKYTPIQAADMLAYSTYRLELNRRFPLEQEPDFPVLPCFMRMLRGVAASGGGYDLESMKKLVEVVKNKPKGNFSL
jgi:Protein of unknown function (DUF3800)